MQADANSRKLFHVSINLSEISVELSESKYLVPQHVLRVVDQVVPDSSLVAAQAVGETELGGKLLLGVLDALVEVRLVQRQHQVQEAIEHWQAELGWAHFRVFAVEAEP